MSNNNDTTSQQQQESSAIIQYQSDTRFSLLKDVLNKTANASLDKPFNSSFSTEQSRLESYVGWPKRQTQTPVDLAKAGFYYYGIKDMVKCFFCNGGLCNWEMSDVPIEEHARWFPKCSYLRQLMGAEYLEEIRNKFRDVESGFTDDFTYDMTQYYNLTSNEQQQQSAPTSPALPRTPRTSFGQYKASKEREISPTVVLARLDLPGIRKVMGLGFKITTVKRAIENKLKKDGDDFRNLVDLVSACFTIDESDKKLEEKMTKLFDMALFNVPKQANKSLVYNLFTSKFDIEPLIIRFLPDSSTTNLVLVGLNDFDKEKSDFIISELNSKKQDAESVDTIENLFVKKLKVNDNCVEDILQKVYEMRKLNDLEEIFVNERMSFIKSPASAIVIKATATPVQVQSVKQTSTKPDDLAEEVEKLSKERVCVICLDRCKNIMFLPCAHLASCVECSVAMDNCPICRTKVEATIRTYS